MPVCGSIVFNGDDVVGIVTTSTHSLKFDAGIGYVHFVVAGILDDRCLLIKSADEALHECRIVTLPFYNWDKRLVRTALLDIDF